jgi:hypothetical protein
MTQPKTEKQTLKGGAKAKLRQHFLANIGRVMDSDELRMVAENQSEWARRVRELRTEEGYLILTRNDRSELKPGQCLLENLKPAPAFERAIRRRLGPMCWIVMDSPPKCAVRWLARLCLICKGC